jgi:hypothetical protein
MGRGQHFDGRCMKGGRPHEGIITIEAQLCLGNFGEDLNALSLSLSPQALTPEDLQTGSAQRSADSTTTQNNVMFSRSR